MVKSGPYDARELANYLLDASEHAGVSLSITSLLKIIYFAHGWHLALFETPLIGQPFEAWQHGPVVRVVYDSFKSESGGAIKTRARKFDPKRAKYTTCTYDFGEKMQKFLNAILTSYSKHHPYKLSQMTHDSDSPWTEVWERSESESVIGMRIPDEAIMKYFLSQNSTDIYVS